VVIEPDKASSTTVVSAVDDIDEGAAPRGQLADLPVDQVGEPVKTETRVTRIAPDIVGLDVLDAHALATGSGLSMAVTVWETKIGPWGMVLSQLPEAGERVKPGTRVDVIVSGRPHLTVPDVRGLAAHTALERLRSAGLRPVSSQERSSRTVAPGHAISSRPRSGSLVVHGASVSLIISQAPGGPVVSSAGGPRGRST
jgi:beta-lactam-binding protein with PASTA domain